MTRLLPCFVALSLLAACGGGTEEECASSQRFEAYLDADHDGAGNPAKSIDVCELPLGYVRYPDDCDDRDAARSPRAEDVCNGVDDDCDGRVDEFHVTLAFWPDDDGDGWGDLHANPVWACAPPEGTTAAVGDCDDTSASVSPDGTEVCNDGVDDDCDGLFDDEDGSLDPISTPVWFRDLDEDGFGDPAVDTVLCVEPPFASTNANDCDDRDDRVNPNGLEVCNGLDDDCDGLFDDDDPSLDPSSRATWYVDGDGDGVGGTSGSVRSCAPPSGHGPTDDDCDDADDTVLGPSGWLLDFDGDGVGVQPVITRSCTSPGPLYAEEAAGNDCDDDDPAVSPSALEVCNGTDDDCDGATDDADGSLDLTSTFRWYLDEDLDGHGVPSEFQERCEGPAGTAPSDDDCDDTQPDVNPSADEVCNGIDDDCDGWTDDADPTVDPTTWSLWYLDLDLDGFGTVADVVASCAPPMFYADDATDCDDSDPAVGGAGLWAVDADGDGYGSIASQPPLGVFCAQPQADAVRLDAGADCDDTEPAVNPAALEVCADGVDQDCSGAEDCELLHDDWEDWVSGVPAGWDIAVGPIDMTGDPAIGDWALRMRTNGARVETEAPLDTTGCSELELELWVHRGPWPPQSWEQLTIEVSNGIGWLEVEAIEGMGFEDPDFVRYVVPITQALALAPDFRLALESSSIYYWGGGYNDFFVDEITLTCL